jgi:hypothetical protein
MKATSPTVTVFGSLPAAILSTTMSRVMIPRNWPSSPHTASADTPSSRIRWPARRRVFSLPMSATSATAVSPMPVTATSRWSSQNQQPAPVPPRLALLRKVGPGPAKQHRAKGPLSASTQFRCLQTAITEAVRLLSQRRPGRGAAGPLVGVPERPPWARPRPDRRARALQRGQRTDPRYCGSTGLAAGWPAS